MQHQALDQRNALVEANLHLIRPIATRIRRRLPASFCLDDLMQAGAIGLIAAADTYDASRGAKFETYAWFKIRGAILDSIIRPIQVGLRSQQLDIKSAIAVKLSVPAESDDRMRRCQQARAVARAVQRLPVRLRLVVLLRYRDGLPQIAVGKILGVTGGRVSQLEKHALNALRQTARSGTAPPCRGHLADRSA